LPEAFAIGNKTNSLLERAVDKTNDLRKKHEQAWKVYGCTLMSDGWTATRHHHLINFLGNSPAGTFFLGSFDASTKVADGRMLTDLLDKQIERIRKRTCGKEQMVLTSTSRQRAGFWTPCATHYLDLLLEDLGKINEFHKCIDSTKKVCKFIY
jgi:hypothetical protein